jgi:subtilisin family serine protease
VHVAHGAAPRTPRRPRLLARAYYASFLRDLLPVGMQRPEPTVHYAYAHAATGFAARLTRRQARHLTSVPSVLAVVPDGEQWLHTTRTPKFLGLSTLFGLLAAADGATDVVIGVIDSGIYPVGRASFAARPSSLPPPSRFRGRCISTPAFNASAYCNGKLVGAKFFYKGYEEKHGPIDETKESKSPLDVNGHGTHAASIAAGSAVTGASFFNYAKGRAVGVAPGARIASYKACWKGSCTESDVLAAFDEAIADGVDVISVSLGANGAKTPLHEDPTAVGAFSAVRKGIVVSGAAGNEGPGEATVSNVAPWIITVGASTVNRWFLATAVLGNGKNITGASLYAGEPPDASMVPLVYSGNVGSAACKAGKLNAKMVAGKIVLCDPSRRHEAQAEAVRRAGGAGAILSSDLAYGEQTSPSAYIIPAATVTALDSIKIRMYIMKQPSATATIVFHGTVIGRTPSSPRLASFSSRGPNIRAPEILKPDITAPGVGILAAWTGEAPPSGLSSDTRRVQFNILSGTSMACPHVSGVAALLRQARPVWSPAAIKSAMMTTAYNVDNTGGVIRDMSTGKASTPFARGAGHVDPNGALDPGLVYDARADDYVSFLCALRYTAEQIGIFTRDGSVTNCSARTGSTAGDLNYPAFSVVFDSGKGSVTQRRVVRNVGSSFVATYNASVTSPAGVRVTVEPPVLRFDRGRSRKRYAVTFEQLPAAKVKDKYSFGSIAWSDGSHTVTIPVAVTWPATQVAAM